jgi:hypothetical protein
MNESILYEIAIDDELRTLLIATAALVEKFIATTPPSDDLVKYKAASVRVDSLNTEGQSAKWDVNDFDAVFICSGLVIWIGRKNNLDDKDNPGFLLLGKMETRIPPSVLKVLNVAIPTGEEG